MLIDVKHLKVNKPAYMGLPCSDVRLSEKFNIFDTDFLKKLETARKAVEKAENELTSEMSIADTINCYESVMAAIRPLMLLYGNSDTAKSSNLCDYIKFYDDICICYEVLTLKYINDSTIAKINKIRNERGV